MNTQNSHTLSLPHVISILPFLPVVSKHIVEDLVFFTNSIATAKSEGKAAFCSSHRHIFSIKLFTFKSIIPFFFTGKYVTLKPSASKARHESSTHLCSVCVVIMCFFLDL